jgi:rhomboid domain-containing protein 1
MFGGGGFGGMPFGMFGGIPYMGGGGFGRGRRGRGGFNPWFLMMAIRLWNEIDRLPVKPPVTLGVMALSSALHFGILGDRTFSASDACLNPRAVIELGEWHRLVTAPLFYADEMHLVYNLSSMLWKGVQLETRMGSEAFAKLLVFLLVSVNAAACAVAWVTRAHFASVEEAYYRSCVTGSAGVLFALKSVIFSGEDAAAGSNFFGMFFVTRRWASWAELALVYFLNPRDTGGLIVNLCGVLVGMAYARNAATLGRWMGIENAGGARRDGGGGGGGFASWFRRAPGEGRRAPPRSGRDDADATRAAADAARARQAPPPPGMRNRRADASAAASSASSSGGGPGVGARVVLAGLRAADMNGKKGVVSGPDPNSSGTRMFVRLDTGLEFSVKPVNLIEIDA